jgi:UPF0755 protein
MRRFRLTRRWVGSIIAVLVVVLLIGAYSLYQAGLKPVSSKGAAKIFTVAEGQRAPVIATDLKQAGLIRDRNSWLTYINIHGLRTKLKAGSYSLAPTQSGQQIAAVITSGVDSLNEMIIPEGFTIAQIEAAVAQHGISEASFEAALAEPHSQSFLADKPAGVSLEGYLFPDTYSIGPETTASSLVNEMLDNFGVKVGPSYTQAFAAEGLTLHQGLTLASIVEKEVNSSTDRPIVAQIFLKRYHTGMSLGSDVTAEYASELAGVPLDININSPYNTRLNTGLPPGPICNPGLGSLDAVAHPAATDYLYFVTGSDGVTYYANTLAQHNANVAAHLK